jgi:sigma-B regulation protein RsbU (phosphoserine phosphatase)
MRPNIEAIPLSSTSSAPSHSAEDSTPILALKELVATLHREQNKVQNLLSSLGFALRSFNNLNQFLELTPLMAARVTDADGSALILIKSPNSITLEQLHCQDSQITQKTQSILEELVHRFNNETADTSSLGILDGQIRQMLGMDFRLYSTPILIKNEERGRIYVFSKDRQYVWTQTRRRLLQLIADQTAVAIANSELTVGKLPHA